MYRVSKDKRVTESAQRIVTGLRKCLNQKSFNEISVSDISREAAVSRATFYRLFDTPTDILEYSCDNFAESIVNEYKNSNFDSHTDAFRFILEHWMAHSDIIEAIAKSGRIGLLMHAMENHMREITPENPGIFTPEEQDYVKAALFAQMGAMLMVWARHGKKESPDMIMRLYRKFHIGK